MPSVSSIQKTSVNARLRMKDGGSYYTPKWLASRTVELTFANAKFNAPPRMLDPACGDGVFLTEYFNYAQKYFKKTSVLSILRSIHGSDIDAKAVQQAQESLFSLVCSYLKRSHIKTAKQIIAKQIAKANITEVFDPKQGITPQFLLKGQFELILGNPPWRINRERRDYDLQKGQWNFARKSTTELIQAKQDWRSSNKEKVFGDRDIYLLFLRAYELLMTKSGTVGVILPDSFLLTTSAEKHRSRLVLDSRTYIEGYVNSGKAFGADSRKKFEIVVNTKQTKTALSCSFGNRAGKLSPIASLHVPIKLDGSELTSIENGAQIPDIRSLAELEIFRRINENELTIQCLGLNSNNPSITTSLNIVRGSDIQYAKSLLTNNSAIHSTYSVVWRKISKDDNTRTLLCSMVNDSQITDTNSVHRIGGLDTDSALFLFTILNSSAAEFYAKCLMTVNLTRELIYSIPIPDKDSLHLILAAYICGKEVFNIPVQQLVSRYGRTVSQKAAALLSKNEISGNRIRALALVDYLVSQAYELDSAHISVLLKDRFTRFLGSYPDFEQILSRLIDLPTRATVRSEAA